MTTPLDDPQHVAIAFDSSVLAGAAYDLQHSLLQLDFYNGSSYRYFDVPTSTWEALLTAKSKGTFFQRAIRSHFRFLRLT
jgi:KTSC domain